MGNTHRMAGSRAGHPEGWPCMACLLSTPHSTRSAILPMAVPRLGQVCPWAQRSTGTELPDAGAGSDTPSSPSGGQMTVNSSPKTKVQQQTAREVKHKTPKGSTKPWKSIMDREKHFYVALLEGICKGNKKVRGKGEGLYLASGRELNAV